jgi:hypothetical protein
VRGAEAGQDGARSRAASRTGHNEGRGGPGLSRRGVLAGAAGLAVTGATGAALAGCRLPGIGGAPANSSPTPAHPLSGAISGSLALLSQYDATIAAQPTLAARLAPLRAQTWTHVTALSKAAGVPEPSGSAGAGTGASPAAPGSPQAALAALAAAERSAANSAVSACLAAAPQHAALLGSIAACRATHLEVLR